MHICKWTTHIYHLRFYFISIKQNPQSVLEQNTRQRKTKTENTREGCVLLPLACDIYKKRKNPDGTARSAVSPQDHIPQTWRLLRLPSKEGRFHLLQGLPYLPQAARNRWVRGEEGKREQWADSQLTDPPDRCRPP